MTRDPLLRAWIGLCALSMIGAFTTLFPGNLAVLLTILALALLKSRAILHHYLGLAAAPRWRCSFDSLTFGFITLIAVLAILGRQGSP